MTVGEKIRKRRKELGMTMEDLGRAIGVQRSAINKYEKGMITDFKRSTIAALARALDVPVTYLLDDDENNTLMKRITVNSGKTFREASKNMFNVKVESGLSEAGKVKVVLSTDPEARNMMKLWKVATPEGRRLAMDILKISNEKGR